MLPIGTVRYSWRIRCRSIARAGSIPLGCGQASLSPHLQTGCPHHLANARGKVALVIETQTLVLVPSMTGATG